MLEEINDRGLILLGCGKMGAALLQGWLARGVDAQAVHVRDPAPSDWLRRQGVYINATLPDNPAVAVIAVKPQMMQAALPDLQGLGQTSLLVSIAAGTAIKAFENAFSARQPIVRAMPNTPAAIGRGVSAMIGNSAATAHDLDLADALLRAVGQVVRLTSEDQIDAVTGVSGSGPAYVFHLIETLAAAGAAQGLPEALAMQLAKATVAGAGQLAEASEQTPGQLRVNVTSPGGTTEAALEVLMDPAQGFPALLPRAVAAATARGRALRAAP